MLYKLLCVHTHEKFHPPKIDLPAGVVGSADWLSGNITLHPRTRAGDRYPSQQEIWGIRSNKCKLYPWAGGHSPPAPKAKNFVIFLISISLTTSYCSVPLICSTLKPCDTQTPDTQTIKLAKKLTKLSLTKWKVNELTRIRRLVISVGLEGGGQFCAWQTRPFATPQNWVALWLVSKLIKLAVVYDKPFWVKLIKLVKFRFG